jgi:hypothetical protein
MACSLTKVSQCLSYLRLFPGRTNEVFCHTMIVFITTYTIVCIFIALLQCQPIRAHWNPHTGLECINMRATLAAIAALNSFSDLMIYLLVLETWSRTNLTFYRRPVKPLLAIEMPFKQRWGLMSLLAFSLLPCIAGMLRLYYVELFYDSADELCKYMGKHNSRRALTRCRECKYHLVPDDDRNEPWRSLRLPFWHPTRPRHAFSKPLRWLLPFRTAHADTTCPSTRD